MPPGDGDPVHPLTDPEFLAGLRPVPSGIGDDVATWPASDLVGTTPDGAAVSVELDRVDGPLLLVFLSTNCDGCDQLWEGLRTVGRGVSDGAGGLDGVTVVVVTKGPGTVSVGEVAGLAVGSPSVPVVMGDGAWADYRVTGYPFLVLVEPTTRRILAETVAFGWSDVAGTVRAGLGR